MRPRSVVSAGVLAVVFAAPAMPQEGPLALSLPASARALALADLYPVGEASPDAVFYAPAFARGLRGVGGGVQWFDDASVLVTASGGREWLGGAVGVGVRALSYSASSSDPPHRGDLFTGDSVPVSERTISLGYARRVIGLEAGIGVKWVEQRIGDGRDDGAAFDLGLGKDLSVVRVQLAAFDLGGDLDVDGHTIPLPTRLVLTAASGGAAPLGPLDVFPVVGMTWQDGEDLIPAAGVELGYWPVVGRTFYLRGGVRRAPQGARPFTLGGGFTGDVIALDYAFEPHEDGRAAHRIGVSFR